MELPPYVTSEQFSEAKDVAEKLFFKYGYKGFSREYIDEQILTIMKIISAKGGGFNKEMYYAFGDAYVKSILHLVEPPSSDKNEESGECNSD